MDDSRSPAGGEGETVTLSRAEYETLLDRLEDAEDLLAVRERELAEARVGVEAARAGYLSIEDAQRIWAGEHPVRVYRERQSLGLVALARRAGVNPPYLSEIENGRKPGSFEAMTRLARALGVSIDALAATAAPVERDVAKA